MEKMERECLTLFIVGSLRDLLIEEKQQLRALIGPVEELIEKLNQLEDMFDDTAVRQDAHTSVVVDHCNTMMDDIDEYALRESTKTFGFRERRLRPQLLFKINQLIPKITELISKHRLKTIKVGDGSSLGLSNKVPPLSDEDFVGRESDIKSLVSYLEDSNNRVISISGMGGLGKTTLSRKVCKHEHITSKFERCAFIRLGQNCNVKTIMQEFLRELLHGEEEDIRFMGDDELVKELQKVLSETKCLVVVDDIWSVEAWTSLCRALPTIELSQSKVLLTTRNRDVANVGDIVHHLKGLSEEESWELFQSKTLPRVRGRDLDGDTKMEKLGKKMVNWCTGNPLAIRVLRGVLVTKPSLPEWERVYHTVQTGQKGVDDVLALSYNELPYQLKPCYLYLCRCCHPSDMKINMLYKLWNAEGMILSRDRKGGETMTEVAEQYMDELVRRNMVEISEDYLGVTKMLTKVDVCMHDLMEQLCHAIAKKENFFERTRLDLEVNNDRRGSDDEWVFLLGDGAKMGVFSGVEQDSMKIPRHAIYFTANARWYVDAPPDIRGYMRSLTIKWGSGVKLSHLKKLKLLRVLDIQNVGTNDESIGKGIGNLIHTRFLSLHNVTLASFPSSLCNLRQLQTLDLRVVPGGDTAIIPKLIWKLPKLKHLFLPKPFTLAWYSSLCQFRGFPQLETLVNFLAPSCCVSDLAFLTKLRRLKAQIIADKDYPSAFGDLEIIMNHIMLNRHQLVNTSLEIHNESMEPLEDKWKQLLSGCQWLLNSLSLFGNIGELPDILRDANQQNGIPSSLPLLTKLYLNSCTFDQWPFPTIGKISNLRTLTVEGIKVEGNANEITFGASEFPQLRRLSLSGFNLNNWRIEQGAMPNLQKLHILRCPMEMLPEGLNFITTLQQLLLMGFPNIFKNRIEPPSGEDFYKIRHIADITFINDVDLSAVMKATRLGNLE